MKFGYTIIYVDDVNKTVSFYQEAFGIRCKMIHESNMYAEMETGETILAFVADKLAASHGFQYTKNTSQTTSAGIEIAFVTEDVNTAYQRACDAGAVGLKEPEEKSWGQVVSYVRDLNGCLVEICSPIG